MIAHQCELQYEAVRKANAPVIADKMVSYLERVGDWRTRKDLNAALGLTDRECRLGRQHSNGRIIFGQRGFKATRSASQGEISACVNTLVSQADEMRHEADSLRNFKQLSQAERSCDTQQEAKTNA